MQARGVLRAGAAPQSRRLAVLLLVGLGFLTMHGFVASAGPATAAASSLPAVAAASHDGDRTSSLVESTGEVAGGHGTVLSAGPTAGAGAPPEAGDGTGHEPADHSDLMAGCVLALVGVAGLALAVAALRRRGLLGVDGLMRRVQVVAESFATAPILTSSPHRLCVMRV